MIKDFISAALLLIILVLITVLLLGASNAAPSCMTYREAREKWPKIHLYWRTEHRCWTNNRHTPRSQFRPRKKMDPVINSYAAAKEKEPEDKCCWPVLPRDGSGNIIEPLPTFAERWRDILSVFRKWWPLNE